MAKPVAFADEQIDADLWQIVGPWDQVQPRNYRNSIRPPLRVSSVEAHQDKVTFPICDGTGSAGKISLARIARKSRRKLLVRRLASRRAAMITATVVATLGAGLYALTTDMTQRQNAVASQSASNGPNIIVDARVRNRPTDFSKIAILERATEPPSAVSKTSGLEFTNRTAQRLAINKGLRQKASGVGRLAIAKHNALKSKAFADEPLLTSLPYGFVGLVPTKAWPSSSLLEESDITTEATTLNTKENSVTDRRDSVQAMRSLRRQ
jgi:hypothetical protein